MEYALLKLSWYKIFVHWKSKLFSVLVDSVLKCWRNSHSCNGITDNIYQERVQLINSRDLVFIQKRRFRLKVNSVYFLLLQWQTQRFLKYIRVWGLKWRTWKTGQLTGTTSPSGLNCGLSYSHTTNLMI